MAKRARGKNSEGNDNQKAYINNFEFEAARTKKKRRPQEISLYPVEWPQYIFYIFGRGIHAPLGMLARGVPELKLVHFKVVAVEP